MLTDPFVESIPGLSFQQKRILSEEAADLKLWLGPQLEDLWPENAQTKTKVQVKAIFNQVISKIHELRCRPINYSHFNPNYDFTSPKRPEITYFESQGTIMGRCPCPAEGELTRCCNLKTLDAVQQCGFACAYCSIQSFYSKGKIQVVKNLENHLKEMKLDSDTWHIGTGQSSDSLLLGDDWGTMTALCNFASANPDKIIELKTKSARTDWTDKLKVPKNMVATWSMNAKTIVQKEEHLTASVEARIKAASYCISKGVFVGFHIHPMVWFENWKEEYQLLVKALIENIDPNFVVMIGIGTLTFTKQNLNTLRESQRPTRVTQMDFTPIAGKFSYPLAVKQEMFSYLYSLFPQDWKDKVFFYLCMEDPSLWQPCLGRSYKDNKAFENDMRKAYLEKVHSNK